MDLRARSRRRQRKSQPTLDQKQGVQGDPGPPQGIAQNSRESLAPRCRLADKHVPRDILERVIALDERFFPRRHLDRARLARVVSRPVKVVVRRQELREDLGLFNFGERMEED